MNSTFFLQTLPPLLQGTLVSLEIAFLSSFIGIMGGIMLGIMQSSKSKYLYGPIAIYATIIRGTPMLIQIAMMHYVIFPSLGIYASAFASAVTAIGINSAAYVSQIVRAGIMSVDKGQVEAAKTLGLSSWQTMYYIVLPQALRMVIPAFGNEFITLIKDSSLASTIGVYELFKEGNIVISRTYNAIDVYIIIASIYLILTSFFSVLVTILERKMNWYVKS